MIQSDELRRGLMLYDKFLDGLLDADERHECEIDARDAFPALARECLAWRELHPESVKTIEEAYK